MLAFYQYYVENTIISFEYEAPTLEEYLERIKVNTEKYPWLVCLENNETFALETTLATKSFKSLITKAKAKDTT